MSNISLPTTNGHQLINFAPGDIVNARGQIAVIMDVLRSNETNNMVIYARFVHNIGNARAYDVLELTPERVKTLGIDQWQPATRAQLDAAIATRREWLEKELQAVANVAKKVSTPEELPV